MICRARNAIHHFLPDGSRIATYVGLILAASGVITVVWVLARNYRSGGGGGRQEENDNGGAQEVGSVLTPFDHEDTFFSEYSLHELRLATDGFSSKHILSKQGEDDVANVVYHGTIPSLCRSVAIKRFHPSVWPEAEIFLKEAKAVGLLRSARLANLIGFCSENGERLLVAEFMPHQTLAENLHGDVKPLSWALRLQIAHHLAQSLEYCKRKGRRLYNKLNAHRILFDVHGNPRLSSFGLMKNNSDESCIIPDNLVYSFGIILLDLLKRKDVPLSKALDLMREDAFTLLMDSSLEGHSYSSDVIQVMQLACSCLQDNPREQPDLTKIVTALANLQIYDSVSDIGKAYASAQINKVHDVLESDAYRENEIASCKEAVDPWSDQPSEIIHAKNRGDVAFQSKEFSLVVEHYSMIVNSGAMDSPTVLARRSFAYVALNWQV